MPDHYEPDTPPPRKPGIRWTHDDDFMSWLNRRATEAINGMLAEVNEQMPTPTARQSRWGAKKRRWPKPGASAEGPPD